MRGFFATATAVFQVALYKRVQCSEADPYNDDEAKVFNDPIHGHIELPAICVRIINTPEFLRLRQIKQLGTTYEVFPGAAHNRFEHSLGVCHLAGQFGRHLQQQIDEELKNGSPNVKKEMKITKDDIICLQIAGLCHDIGHGPMSHAFQSHFIRNLNPKWKHEKFSTEMFDYLVNKYKHTIRIKPEDQAFIKQLIYRDKETNHETGRPKEKDFLYEIIANEENGIDVDKWDYFARDSYHLGIGNNFDHRRLIKFSRALEADGAWHICYRDKQEEDIYQMYFSRLNLHRRAYQHKTVRIIERMYMEALEKADEHYKMTSRDGKTKLKISECITNPELFSQLTDHVFHNIRISNNEELKEARDILELIDTRRHYKLVSKPLPIRDEKPGLMKQLCEKIFGMQKNTLPPDEKQILKEIVKYSNGKLKEEDLVVDIPFFDLGRKSDNPVDHVHFYEKAEQGQKYNTFYKKREDISRLLPEVYSEYHIRLYIKKDDKNLLKEARKCFEAWCKKRNMGGIWKSPNPPADE